MNSVIVVGIGLLMLNCIGLTWLYIGHRQLNKKLVAFQSMANNLNQEMDSLCEASERINQRLTDADQMLMALVEKLAELEQLSQSSQPYHGAIQQVQNGASVEELVQQFNISRDEAVLLIRLHGNRAI